MHKIIIKQMCVTFQAVKPLLCVSQTIVVNCDVSPIQMLMGKSACPPDINANVSALQWHTH